MHNSARRRQHRPHRRAPHLGLGAQRSPACPSHRPGRRPVAGRVALDRLQARLLTASVPDAFSPKTSRERFRSWADSGLQALPEKARPPHLSRHPRSGASGSGSNPWPSDVTRPASGAPQEFGPELRPCRLGRFTQARNCAVESTWSSWCPPGRVVSPARPSASHGASSSRKTKPFSTVAGWACGDLVDRQRAVSEQKGWRSRVRGRLTR
jgi:hypothetical protein